MARWTLRPDPYKISPPDADRDMIIQEDTAWERPGGLQLIDRLGNLIQEGMSSDIPVDGLRYVDADGREHAYTPRWAGKIDVEEDELGGLETLKDMGLRTVGDMSKPLTGRTIAAKKKAAKERVQQSREDRIAAVARAVPGTFGKPTYATDIDEALDLIEAGHFVELSNDNEVHTLIDKLAEMVLEAHKLGVDAPDYNLCLVSVSGSNIFCADQFKHSKLDNLRSEMPQLGGEAMLDSLAYEQIRPQIEAARARIVRTEMVDGKEVHFDVDGKEVKIPSSAKAGEAWKAHLREGGWTVEELVIQSSRLKASQKELVGEKVAGMVQAGLFKRRAMEAAEANAKDPSISLLIDDREYLQFDDARKGKKNPDFGKEVTLEKANKLWTPLNGKIFVSKDGYVIDGHHRWAAILGMDAADGILDNEGDLVMTVDQVGLTIHEALADANAFTQEFGIKPKAAVADDMGGGAVDAAPARSVDGGPRREVVDTFSRGRAASTDITDVAEADLDYGAREDRTKLASELLSLESEVNERIAELKAADGPEAAERREADWDWDTNFRDDPDLSDEAKAELEELYEDKKKYSGLRTEVKRTIDVGSDDPFEDSSPAEFAGSEATAHVTETMAAVADVEEIIRERRRENHLASARAEHELSATQEAHGIARNPGYQQRVSQARPEPTLEDIPLEAYDSGELLPFQRDDLRGTRKLSPGAVEVVETPDSDNPRSIEVLIDRADQTRVTARDITTWADSRVLLLAEADAAISVLTGTPSTLTGRGGTQLTGGVAALEERLENPGALEVGDAGYRLVNGLYEQRGFNGKPLRVTSDELDELLLSGGFLEVVRGGSADAQDQHLNGELLLGNGVDGAGFYFAIELGDVGQFPAAQYATDAPETEDGRPGTVIRGGLNPTAKIISLTELDEITDGYEIPNDAIGVPDLSKKSPGPQNNLIEFRRNLSRVALLTEDHPLYDEERVAQALAAIRSLDLIMTRSMDGEEDHVTTAAAMLMGYDAIMSDQTRMAHDIGDVLAKADNRLIVLNRSAVVMADTALDVKEIDGTPRAVDADGNPVVGSTHLASRMNPKLDERGAPRYDPSGSVLPEATTFVEGYVASALEQFDEVNVGVLGGEADVPDSRQVLADEIRGQIEVLEGELQEIRNRLNATDEFGGDLYHLGDQDNAIAKQAEMDVLQSDLDDVFAGRSDDGPSVQDRVAEKLARVRRKKLHGTEETAAIPFDPEEHEATVAADVELTPLPDAFTGTGFDGLTDDELGTLYEGLTSESRVVPELPQNVKDVLELLYEGEALRDHEFAPIILNRLQARGLMVPTAEEAAAKRGRDNLYILTVEKLTGVKMTDYARDHIYNLPATGKFAHHLEIPRGLTTEEVKIRGAVSVAAHMGGEDLDQLHDIIMGLRSGGLDKEVFGERVAGLLGTLKDVDRRELATAVIAQVHDAWARSSGDHHPISLATQVAAARAAGMNQDEMLARAFYFLEQARDRNAAQQMADSIVARIRRGEISPDVLSDENKLKALVLRHGTLSDDIMEMATGGGGLLPGSGASESMMGFSVNDDMPTGTIGINAGHSLTAMDDVALETIGNLDLDAVARTEGKSMLELVYEVDPKTGKRPEVIARMEEIRQELGLDAWDDLPLDDPESRPLALEYLELAKRETPAIGSDEQAVWDLFLALRRDDILPSSPHDSRLGQPYKGLVSTPLDPDRPGRYLVDPSPRWEEAHLDAQEWPTGGYFNFEKASDIGLLMDRDRIRAAIAEGRTEAQFSQIIPAEFELLGIEEELKRRGVVENDRQHEALTELMASVQAVADLELDRRGQGGVMPSVSFGETPHTFDSGARVEYMQAAVGALIVDDFFGEYNQSVLSADTAAAQEFLKGIANADGTITLYRGVNTDAFRDGVETGETVWDVNASPRSSWAFDPSVAQNFAGGGSDGYVFESRIPIEDVAGLSILGSGCLGETEVLVVGKDREVKIYYQNETSNY